MTDKERYEYAMKENHELREKLKSYKEALQALEEQIKNLSRTKP